jgi:hypothetical protein
MNMKAAITVHRSRDEVERLWGDSTYRPPSIEGADAAVMFKPAPGDHGTEIHVELEGGARGGRLGRMVQSRFGAAATPKLKDDLRRFKQRVETGEIPRSDGVPGGESVERKLRQRPAQPLPDSEPAGAR